MGYELTGRDWYRLSGEEKPYDDHIQGGFVLYQPRFHGELMRTLYETHVGDYLRYHQDDQSFLSSYGMDHGLIQWIDERFDCVWPLWKRTLLRGFETFPYRVQLSLLDRFLTLNYFSHFPSNEEHQLLARWLYPDDLRERFPWLRRLRG